MTFPIISTVEASLAVLSIAMNYAEAISPDARKALESIQRRYRLRDKKRAPAYFDRDVKKELARCVALAEQKVVFSHLARLFELIVPYQKVLAKSTDNAALPRYAAALDTMIRQLHNSLFAWNCFGRRGDRQTVGKAESLIFLEAHHTSAALRNCSFFKNLKIWNVTQTRDLYFGIHKSNRTLYLHDNQPDSLKKNNYHQIFFRENEVCVRTGDAQNAVDATLSRNDFQQMAKGLLDDFVFYSQLVRAEIQFVDQILAPVSTSRTPLGFWKVVGAWLYFLKPRRIDEHLREIETVYQNGQPGFTLINTIVASLLITAAAVLTLLSPNGRSALFNLMADMLTGSPYQLASVILSFILGLILFYIITFYQMNTLVYFGIKTFFQKDLDCERRAYQAYILSIYGVPLGIFLTLIAAISFVAAPFAVFATPAWGVGLELFQWFLVLIVLVYALYLTLITLQKIHQLDALRAFLTLFFSNCLVSLLFFIAITLLVAAGPATIARLRYLWDVLLGILYASLQS